MERTDQLLMEIIGRRKRNICFIGHDLEHMDVIFIILNIQKNCYKIFKLCMMQNGKKVCLSKRITAKIPKSFFIAHLYGKEITMQVSDRVKMELSNQEYFSDEQIKIVISDKSFMSVIT